MEKILDSFYRKMQKAHQRRNYSNYRKKYGGESTQISLLMERKLKYTKLKYTVMVKFFGEKIPI